MKAVQYREIGKGPEVVEIEGTPRGSGAGAAQGDGRGLCHSDWFVMDLPEDQYTTVCRSHLGHEGAGVVDELGEGVEGVEIGAAYAIYGPWGAAAATRARREPRIYCPYAAEMGITPPGLGSPGAMAST